MDEGSMRILDLLPQYIGSTSPDLRCRYANKAYAELVGRAQEDMIGASVQELWGPKLFAEVKPFIDRALAGEATAGTEPIAEDPEMGSGR